MSWWSARGRQEWRQPQRHRNMEPTFASLTITQNPVARYGEATMDTVDPRFATHQNTLETARVDLRREARVVAHPAPNVLRIETLTGFQDIRYRRLILATGARERFLPFPGWTLQGVMGVGGLQAMVKAGLPIEGKRVVLSGSGPLLLAVAASACEKRRADPRHFRTGISCAHERRLAFSFFAIPANCVKVRAIAQRRALLPIERGHGSSQAHGDQSLQSVTVSVNGAKCARSSATTSAADSISCQTSNCRGCFSARSDLDMCR